MAQFLLSVGSRTFRLDFAYPDLRIAIEIDGYAYHGLTDRLDSDHARDRELQTSAKWTVLRFSARDIRRTPGRVVRDVRAAIEFRSVA